MITEPSPGLHFTTTSPCYEDGTLSSDTIINEQRGFRLAVRYKKTHRDWSLPVAISPLLSFLGRYRCPWRVTDDCQSCDQRGHRSFCLSR